MTRDNIIRMAQEAHKDLVTVDYPGHVGQLDSWTLRLLERFAALVAAAECKALKDERRRDMAEIYSLRESEESLREENERLRDELRQSSIDYTRAEVERLREQLRLANKWLREALQDIDALKQAAGNDSLGRETERLREELVEAEAVRERCNERAFRLEAEVERLREGIAALRGETAIWSARHDPRE